MFRLTRYFSIASLLLIIVVTALLGAWYRYSAVQAMHEFGERHNASDSCPRNRYWPAPDPDRGTYGKCDARRP